MSNNELTMDHVSELNADGPKIEFVIPLEDLDNTTTDKVNEEIEPISDFGECFTGVTVIQPS